MRVAIMQPTWIPWMGYFDLIDQVDRFVFLDTVQYCPRSWHSRNRIKTASGESWISLPVSGRRREGATLKSAIAYPEHAMRKAAETLRHAYKNATAFDRESRDVFEFLGSLRDESSLADVNISFIKYVMRRFGIETETLRSSDMPEFTGRVGRLISICDHLGADTYVSAPGSAVYLEGYGARAFEEAGIDLTFHRYDHPIYRQCGKGFSGFLSVIDLLFNAGTQAPSILRSGRRTPIPAEQFFNFEQDVTRDRQNEIDAA